MSLEEAQERHRTIGRNDTCPCGSEKKYKKCHQSEDDATISSELTKLADAAKEEVDAKLAEEESDKDDSTKAIRQGQAFKAGKPTDAGKRGGKSPKRGAVGVGAAAKAQSLPRRGAV